MFDIFDTEIIPKRVDPFIWEHPQWKHSKSQAQRHPVNSFAHRADFVGVDDGGLPNGRNP
jgi:hypothetical protein